ncbi:MAG: hypothetical protein M0Q88_05910 [Bacilli bacterium]|nr:hypothetical protein [Bacilli bacterium]
MVWKSDKIKTIALLLFFVLFFINMGEAGYAGQSSLPISAGYSTTAHFVTFYKDGKFVFYFSDGIKDKDEMFLVSIDGVDKLVTLTTKNQVGIVNTNNPKRIIIYRDKERGEISPQFKENYKNYTKANQGKTYFFYREINNINKELSDKDKEVLLGLLPEGVINFEENEEKNQEAIGKVKLLSKNGIVYEHIIYKSTVVHDEEQVKNTIEHIYNKQYGVIEIISLNNVPLSNTKYKEYAGFIRRSNLGSSDEIPANVNDSRIGNIKGVDLKDIGTPISVTENNLVINGIEIKDKIVTKSGLLMLPSYVFEEIGVEVARKYRKDDLDLITLSNPVYKIEMKVKDNLIFVNRVNKYDIAPERVDGKIYLPSHLLHYFGYTTNIKNNKIHVVRGGFSE